MKLVVRFIFPQFCKYDTSRYRYLEVFLESSFDLEIKRVESMSVIATVSLLHVIVVSRIVSDVFASYAPKVDFPNPGHTLLPIFRSFRPMGMVGEACLPSNAYYPRTPDYTLCLLVWTFWFVIRLWIYEWITALVPWPQLLVCLPFFCQCAGKAVFRDCGRPGQLYLYWWASARWNLQQDLCDK